MHTIQFLSSLVAHHHTLIYFAILLGVVFEGEFFVIFSGVLAHLGALNFWVVLVFIICGGLGKTFLGYWIGRCIHDKWGDTKFCRYLKRRVNYFLPHFQRKPFWSIFISKFIMGANHLVILFSGFQKVNFRQFLRAELISTAIWAPGMLLLGYFFSYTAFHISRELWRFSLIILVFIIIFIVLEKVVSWLYEFVEEMYGNGYEE